MIVKEYVRDICEYCGKPEHPTELYVDMFNKSYRMICHTCFMQMYGTLAGEKKYFRKLYNIDPSITSYKVYKQHNKSVIVIANAFPYYKQDHTFFGVDETERIKQQTINMFLGSRKINNKFSIVKSDCKAGEQATPLNGVALIVAIRAWVRFKSYLEYLEHEMYLKFRSECSAIIQ